MLVFSTLNFLLRSVNARILQDIQNLISFTAFCLIDSLQTAESERRKATMMICSMEFIARLLEKEQDLLCITRVEL
ncbi:hypothetical protein SCA6_018268 [Theobroma cacao]